MCATAYQSATMLVLCSNVTVSVKKFTCVSVRHEWSLDQLGRHISTVIIIIKTEGGSNRSPMTIFSFLLVFSIPYSPDGFVSPRDIRFAFLEESQLRQSPTTASSLT